VEGGCGGLRDHLSTVYRSVKSVVDWGLSHRSLEGITAIGVDEIRAGEARRLKQDGYEPVMKHSRWCFLKRPENLTSRQTVKLKELLQYNLKTVRADLHREEFQRFWKYHSAGWARRFFKEWSTRAMRSKVEPLKKMVRTLRKHEDLIFNWFEAKGRISVGIVEGLNNKVKLTMRKSYGFRGVNVAQIALYHSLGNLPEPSANPQILL
jgi:transposase